MSSLINGGLTVVFSPLISLIQDQVDTLSQQGVPAEALTSATEMDEVRRIWDDVFANQTRLLYITPERFKASPALTSKLKSLLDRGQLKTFVIDEGTPHAHIRALGHDTPFSYARFSPFFLSCLLRVRP
jgi:superfamily II DNA helicase RecQ